MLVREFAEVDIDRGQLTCRGRKYTESRSKSLPAVVPADTAGRLPITNLVCLALMSPCRSLPASFALSASTAPKYDVRVHVRDVESGVALSPPSIETRS